MNTELDQLIEGYAELNSRYEEREAALQALNRAINTAVHTPIFSFDPTLLTDVTKTIEKLEGNFPDTKAFLKNPWNAIRELTIDFDLALPGHSALKKLYDQQLVYAERLNCDEYAIYDIERKGSLITTEQTIKLKILKETLAQLEIEYAALEKHFQDLRSQFPLAAAVFDGKTEFDELDPHFDLVLSGYSELKAAYALEITLLAQYNAARKAVTAHPQFQFNMEQLIDLDKKIEVLVKRYPIAALFLRSCDENLSTDVIDALIPGFARLHKLHVEFNHHEQQSQQIIELQKQYPLAAAFIQKDAEKRIVFVYEPEDEREELSLKNAVYFPLDANYLFC